MIGRRCSDPAPGHFLPSLNYFLYEAELAAPLAEGSSWSSSLVCNSSERMMVSSVTGYLLFSTEPSRSTLISSSLIVEWFWIEGCVDLLGGVDRDRWESICCNIFSVQPIRSTACVLSTTAISLGSAAEQYPSGSRSCPADHPPSEVSGPASHLDGHGIGQSVGGGRA